VSKSVQYKQRQLELLALKTGWPLLTNDHGLAKEWLLAAIQQDPANLHILHQALSIGLYKEVARMLETLPINDDAKTTLLYRIYLQKGNALQSYSLINQPYIIQHGQDAIERAQKENKPLDVVLIGGIGDHLETISHITAWQEQTPIKLNLKLSKQRKRQLATIIESLPLISLNPTKEIPLDFRTLRQRILVDQTRVLTKAIYQPATCNSKKQILCCWRAQAGLGEHFSVHARSVPSHLVWRFYQILFQKYPDLIITDISLWKPWEQKLFSDMGIKLHDPSEGDVLKLAHLCASQSQIISVDTALAHLCAVSSCKATLLLTKFPDERWSVLLQPGNCYQDNLRVLRQQTFGDWSETLTQLSRDTVL